MIVNGDTSQIDLPRGVTSGLVNAERTLKDIEKNCLCKFLKPVTLCVILL